MSACRAPAQQPKIDLSALTPLPTRASLEVSPLRVAIAAVISPQGTLESYGPLLAYLEAKLGRPVERVQSATYAETNEILASGLADLAFICTGAYIHGAEESGMQILAVPEIKGETAYYSWIIVPADSQVKDIADLRGGVFAYTDPLSLTGWMYPNFLLLQSNEKPEAFFARTFFTYSHDQAIRAVAAGFADGAAVDSLIYNYLVEREPAIAQKTRLIHQSPAFGMPPVVVTQNIQPQLLAALQAIFLEMADDPEGLAALAALGVDRFVSIDDQAYDSARLVDSFLSAPATLAP